SRRCGLKRTSLQALTLRCFRIDARSTHGGIMLSSMLFRCDAKLQAAARNHTFHITRGAHGLHVSRIQLALLLLSFKVVDDREWRFGLYGESTAAAVLAYKLTTSSAS
ncbi:MAG: hypothetical protein ABL983_25520, partial [Nitrospira sp.]